MSSDINILSELKRIEKKIFHELTRKTPFSPFLDLTKIPLPMFRDTFQRPDFPQRYFKLINGLDSDSRSLVDSMICRLQKALDSAAPPWDIHTSEEKNIFNDAQEKIFGQIVKLSDDMFVYGNYILPKKIFDPGVFYFNYGLGYVQDISKTKNKDILDLGAYIGDSMLLLAPYTNKKVYSFEAHPTSYQDLQKTIKLNNIANSMPINMAVGDSNGSIRIRGRMDDLPATTTKASIRTKEDPNKKHLEFEDTIPVITIDSFVQEHNLDVGLIKVDIEGAEKAFLNGAMHTIATQKPIILLSIYHYPDDFFDLKPMLEDMNLGYKFKIVRGSLNILSGTLLIAEVY
ncbi:FkbM family methyltransferase [Desulfovibrio sp. OttesenSCG-928-A18]|nr:FkbM family methyltransferase [Desulfovibrio sp. OttesenSCG-928-A18]